MPTEEEEAAVEAHIQAGGNAVSLLPDGMTQAEADELVRLADEAQAEKTRRYEAGEEV